MKRRGFSTVELLVVLVIVAILAAVFVAVVKDARKKERRRRLGNCQQHLLQIRLAIKQYLSDHDESFPIVKSGQMPYGWADAIQPYVRNTQILQCGHDDEEPTALLKVGSSSPTVTGDDPLYTDYFYNSRLAGENESSLPYIANTVMLGESIPGTARQHSDGGKTKQPGIASLVDTAGRPIGAATRHRDGAFYVFADGHTKWLKGSDSKTCRALKNAAAGAHSDALGFAVR